MGRKLSSELPTLAALSLSLHSVVLGANASFFLLEASTWLPKLLP